MAYRDLLVDVQSLGTLDEVLRSLPEGHHFLAGERVDGHEVVRTTYPDLCLAALESLGGFAVRVVRWRDEDKP